MVYHSHQFQNLHGIIFAIRKYPCQDSVNTMLWRAGDNRLSVHTDRGTSC
jgi:hypothetical protein